MNTVQYDPDEIAYMRNRLTMYKETLSINDVLELLEELESRTPDHEVDALLESRENETIEEFKKRVNFMIDSSGENIKTLLSGLDNLLSDY